MSGGDPYQVLGVKPDASQADIQKRYRQMVKQLHPDLNPGDAAAEERFKEVAAAYDLLGDPEQRARFDRGEIDAAGMERPHERFYRDFAEGGSHPYRSNAGFADFAADDLLSEILGRSGQFDLRTRGRDVRYRLDVDLLEAINGATKRLALPDGSTLDVTIPAGARNGQVLRLRGQGRPGRGGGPPGDALIEVGVRPHPLFRREGDDVHLELPISLAEAVLGGRVAVPTPTGPVTMRIPKGANSGRVLRLKGKGAPRAGGGRGDEYVTLKVVLPQIADPELERFVAGWAAGRGDNPRAGMEV